MNTRKHQPVGHDPTGMSPVAAAVKNRAQLVEAIERSSGDDVVHCATDDLCGLGEMAAPRMGKGRLTFRRIGDSI